MKHILFINKTLSRCGSCGKEALALEQTHRHVPLDKDGRSEWGCGVKWNYVSTKYSQNRRWQSSVRRVRPDLTWMDPAYAMHYLWKEPERDLYTWSAFPKTALRISL